jgi:tetratricopeptide (TPR) repeat protein
VGAAPAQEQRGDEDRDRQVMERFLAVLERAPRRGTALDRVYGYHVERGTLDDLVRRYQDRATKDPKDGAAWLLLGLIESQCGRDAAAVAALWKAEEHRPDDALPAFYLGLYYGYFENRYCEQFVFTFDRATLTGTVSGGDLGWGDPKVFTLGLLDEALRSIQDLAAQVRGSDARSQLQVIDAALALGRLNGLTGKDQVSWLRACLAACTRFEGWPGDPRSS